MRPPVISWKGTVACLLSTPGGKIGEHRQPIADAVRWEEELSASKVALSRRNRRRSSARSAFACVPRSNRRNHTQCPAREKKTTHSLLGHLSYPTTAACTAYTYLCVVIRCLRVKKKSQEERYSFHSVAKRHMPTWNAASQGPRTPRNNNRGILSFPSTTLSLVRALTSRSLDVRRQSILPIQRKKRGMEQC